MTEELRYVIADIGAGWVGILGSAQGLVRTTLPQPSPQEAQQQLGNNITSARWSPELFEDLVARFKTYFSHHEATFPDGLDLSGATPFQRRVWEKTRLIPFGQTRSYSWMAEQIGQPAAVRAVGQALGRNPIPIIVPCHRVVAADGRLGGYSGGLGMKRYLLDLEATAR